MVPGTQSAAAGRGEGEFQWMGRGMMGVAAARGGGGLKRQEVGEEGSY